MLHVQIPIHLGDHATMPEYKTDGSAGFDLASNESVTIYKGETVAINTGIRMEIPQKFELQIRPRSGLSLKTNLRVILGTIDSDYRGEIKVIAQNVGDQPIIILCGDRIAQGVLAPVVRGDFLEIDIDKLSATVRGDSGFGSTGIGGVE